MENLNIHVATMVVHGTDLYICGSQTAKAFLRSNKDVQKNFRQFIMGTGKKYKYLKAILCFILFKLCIKILTVS